MQVFDEGAATTPSIEVKVSWVARENYLVILRSVGLWTTLGALQIFLGVLNPSAL